MRLGRSRGFTLLELLIVVSIIAVLMTLIVSGVQGARKKALVARAKTEISQIKTALSMYDNDTGKFPRMKAPTTLQEGLDANDIGWVYAALRNRPAASTGGGQGSPYLDWRPENIGYFEAKATPNKDDDATAVKPPFGVAFLEPENFDAVNDAVFQKVRVPWNATTSVGGKNCCLAFFDPWANAYRYREWATVSEAIKGGAAVQRSVKYEDGTTYNVSDRPHEPNRFDIWSYGPNMVNEWGDQDDICSWTDMKK